MGKPRVIIHPAPACGCGSRWPLGCVHPPARTVHTSSLLVLPTCSMSNLYTSACPNNPFVHNVCVSTVPQQSICPYVIYLFIYVHNPCMSMRPYSPYVHKSIRQPLLIRVLSTCPTIHTSTRPQVHAPTIHTSTRPQVHAPTIHTSTCPQVHAPTTHTSTRPQVYAPTVHTSTRPQVHAPTIHMITTYVYAWCPNSPCVHKPHACPHMPALSALCLLVVPAVRRLGVCRLWQECCLWQVDACI